MIILGKESDYSAFIGRMSFLILATALFCGFSIAYAAPSSGVKNRKIWP